MFIFKLNLEIPRYLWGNNILVSTKRLERGCTLLIVCTTENI